MTPILPNLVSGVSSKPPVVAPDKAGNTTVKGATPAPVAHAEGLAHLIPSSSGATKDPQGISAPVEAAPRTRVIAQRYTHDGSGHIFRNVEGMQNMRIATVENDCKMIELQAMLDGLLALTPKG